MEPSLLTNGRIEIDDNAVEPSMGPIVLSRKNALFAGHDVGVLTAIAQGQKQRDIEQLLPWYFGK